MSDDVGHRDVRESAQHQTGRSDQERLVTTRFELWSAHLAAQDAAEVGQPLPPHSRDCVGCGPENPAGLGLQVVRTVDGVEAVHRFTDQHVGAPGIAHGGAVALAFDDLFGFTLYTVGVLAVTRSITVDYEAPFRLHQPYTFSARLVERAGRRLQLRAAARESSERLVGTAAATFVVVGADHFVAGANNSGATGLDGVL